MPGHRREPDAHDPDLDSYLAALAADDQPTELAGRFGSAQVFQLRLPAVRIEQLRRIAAERGVSPGALAVDWVVDRLDREDTPTGPLAVVAEAERRRNGPLSRLRRR
jgi:aryl-alcohol dehydrogenase-like predicted oxidoreductase